MVGALHDKGDMRQLLYPVAQLLTGTARMQDQMKFLPMRLRLISAANSLSLATGVFIPVSSLLIGILSWSYLQKKPTVTGNDKCPNMALCLDVDDKTLKNPVFQSEVVEQVGLTWNEKRYQYAMCRSLSCWPNIWVSFRIPLPFLKHHIGSRCS